jgi:hypothetical protein
MLTWMCRSFCAPARPPADASGASVVWTIGLRKPLLEEEEDGGEELSKDAVAGRAKARAAMLESDAAITLKFARAHAAALEQCVVPLIFKHNPVRLPARSPHMHAHAHDADSPSACHHLFLFVLCRL